MKFYRYETSYSRSVGMGVDGEYDLNNIGPEIIAVHLRVFNVHKETPKGYWIGYGEAAPGKLRGNSRWIGKNSYKKFAYETKEEAKIDFMRRTNYRIEFLKHKINQAKQALEIITKE